MKKLNSFIFRASLFLALVFPCPLFAQTGTTSLHGAITDKSGAATAGARITISNPQTHLERTTTSGDAGGYDFLALPPGDYTLTVERGGYRRYEQAHVELLVNLPATQNVTLQVGSVSQTVEVSATVVALNTTDASIGNAFNENQVKQLPLEGRNVPDLLSLQPGVAYTGNRTDVPTWDTRNGAVNGARSDQSNVLVDGVEANDIYGAAFTSVLPVTRFCPGVPRNDIKLQCGPGRLFRGAGVTSDQKRHERLSRIGLRVPPEHLHQRQRLLCKGRADRQLPQ
jgi:Carboxypeptidase regulatory-like domain